MQQREVIIPEVLKERDMRNLNETDVNINLSQTNNYNNSNYSKNEYSHTDNSTHTTNNTHNRGLIMGFIMFVWFIISLPFKFLIWSYNKIEYKRPKPKHKQTKFFKKWLKNKEKIYTSDEIY